MTFSTSRRLRSESGQEVATCPFRRLDNIQAKTGRTPAQFVAEAKRRGLTEHGEIIRWLEKDYGLGLGHARAIDHVIRKGIPGGPRRKAPK